MSGAATQMVVNLNALAAGLFLLTSFGIVAMRQARGCLHLFIAQSLLLAASAALLGLRFDSGHLYGVALVNLISKPIIVPWLLRRVAPAELYTRREIDQVLNIPTTLSIALALAIGAYFLGVPLARAVGPEYVGPNVPIGIDGHGDGFRVAGAGGEAPKIGGAIDPSRKGTVVLPARAGCVADAVLLVAIGRPHAEELVASEKRAVEGPA